MSGDGVPDGQGSRAHRSAISNGSRALLGVDGRGALARRYRDLVAALSAELGGQSGAAEQLQVRNAATLQLHVEDLTGRLARGEAVEPEAITRAANAATRAISALRRRRPTGKEPKPTVAEYLASRRGSA